MQRQIAEADAEAEADSIAKLHLGVLHAVKIQKKNRLRRALQRPSARHAMRAVKNPKIFACGGLSTDRVLDTLRVR